MVKEYLKSFYDLPEKLRFLLVGGINTGIGYLLFLLFYAVFSSLLSYQVIFALSFIVGIMISFINFKVFVFTAQAGLASQFSKALVSYVSVYVLNTVCLAFFVDCLELVPYIAQALCVMINAVASYCMHKYFSFRIKIGR